MSLVEELSPAKKDFACMVGVYTPNTRRQHFRRFVAYPTNVALWWLTMNLIKCKVDCM
jgi:hypothetical protein